MRAAATIVEDSLAPSGIRLTTMLLTYATIIHQDILTHRSISKNGDVSLQLDSSKSTNSNRAKTTASIINDVLLHPFVPTRFPKRAATMHSSKGYLTGWRHKVADLHWRLRRYPAIVSALFDSHTLGVHKQIANRPLATWQWTTLVMTATQEYWHHFFMLRNHYAAQDEVQEVAYAAMIAQYKSTPDILGAGKWHLPFVTYRERETLTDTECLKLSVARCARTSYAHTHQDMLEIAYARPQFEDYSLHDRLVIQDPEHAGPREHQAMAMLEHTYRSGNLYGWAQLRHSKTGHRMRIDARTVDFSKKVLNQLVTTLR